MEIRKGITGGLGRGMTIYKGKGGLSGEDQEILFCVVTRLEIGKVMNIIESIDKAAFSVMYPLSDAKGGVFKRKRNH